MDIFAKAWLDAKARRGFTTQVAKPVDVVAEEDTDAAGADDAKSVASAKKWVEAIKARMIVSLIAKD